jgi:hypothetical protein
MISAREIRNPMGKWQTEGSRSALAPSCDAVLRCCHRSRPLRRIRRRPFRANEQSSRRAAVGLLARLFAMRARLRDSQA